METEAQNREVRVSHSDGGRLDPLASLCTLSGSGESRGSKGRAPRATGPMFQNHPGHCVRARGPGPLQPGAICHKQPRKNAGGIRGGGAAGTPAGALREPRVPKACVPGCSPCFSPVSCLKGRGGRKCSHTHCTGEEAVSHLPRRPPQVAGFRPSHPTLRWSPSAIYASTLLEIADFL